ncbi:MAG TPA: hydrogenase maturation nickel metallochaperone HypA [Chloroflexi bacterium]|nr:hydrogenase maturation nickel metallochaperone HypA [Chloroflexota bacterium]
MHELSIAYNLVEIAHEAARSAGALRVNAVHLRLGALSGVVEDALRFSFPIAAVGTLVEGAALVIEPVAVQIYCDHCATSHTLTPPFVFRCPVCEQPVTRLLHGRELQIESIEIEETETELDRGVYATAHS